MKTHGVEVWGGYVATGYREKGEWKPHPGIVPDAFWARLKHLVAKAMRVDEFKADEARVRETWTGHDVEIAVFRMWVGKLGIELPAGHYPGERLWPWSRGWTEAAVDAYLAAPVAARAA